MLFSFRITKKQNYNKYKIKQRKKEENDGKNEEE